MNKIKKILPIILVIGLLNGCFGLTIAAKAPKATKVEQKSKENKKVNYAYGFQFDYCFKNAGMEKDFGKQENPARVSGKFDENKIFNKTDVKDALAFAIMSTELIRKIKDKTIKKNEDHYLDLLAESNLTAPLKKIQVLGTTEGIYGNDGLTKEQLNKFKKVLTKENFKKVEITKEKLEKVVKHVIPILEKRIMQFKKTKDTNLARNLKNHIKEIKNAKLEDVKKAARNFADCKMRIEKFDPSKAKG